MLLQASPKSTLIADLEGRTPLHYACINNRSNYDLVEILVKACPQAAFEQDSLKRTPLHFSCMASIISSLGPELQLLTGKLVEHATSGGPTSSVAVVKLLLKTNPQALSTVDFEGKTPLHCLADYVEKQPLETLPSTELLQVMEMLVEVNPRVVLQSDESGSKPIDGIRALHLRAKFEESSNNEQYEALLERIISLVESSQQDE